VYLSVYKKKEMGSTDRGTAVLLVGSGKLVASVAACLLIAGHRVTVGGAKPQEQKEAVESHLTGRGQLELVWDLQVTEELPESGNFGLALILGAEVVEEKRAAIRELELRYGPELIICVASESIPLSDLQAGCRGAERILIANWVEPAHTTFFLELVANEVTSVSWRRVVGERIPTLSRVT
jgi:3-hydroxybutyryl-CoA dehydrogenase